MTQGFKRRMGIPAMGLAAISAAMAGTGSARAEIVASGVIDIEVVASGVELDLDMNGVGELNVYVSLGICGICSINADPLLPSTQLVMIQEGELLQTRRMSAGELLDNEQLFGDGGCLNTQYGECQWNDSYPATGFIGVRFDIASSEHFGWIQYTATSDTSGTVVQWAYEDTPGTPILAGNTGDCNGDGVPNVTEVLAGALDCNGNWTPDDCDIADGYSSDCNDNGIPDECDIAGEASADCNGNGIPDECDIADGTSQDINGNGIPDECETDCNDNGIPDDFDIASGTSDDCNGNGTPDECEVGPLPGPALSFDGAQSYAIALGVPFPSDFTVSFWMRADEGEDGAMFSHFTGEFVQVVIHSPTNLKISLDPYGYYETGIDIADGFWHHIALTDDPDGEGPYTSLILYVDGELRWQSEPEVVPPWSSSGSLALGQRQYCQGGCFDPNVAYGGDLDEVRLWNYPRTGEQILAEMFTPLSNYNGLVGYWPLNEGGGGVAGDPVGLHDATIVDATWIETPAYICCADDCNGNGVDDCDDIAQGISADCDNNGIPDTCQIDSGLSQDLNGNGIPDECDPDCNGNGIPDDFEIARGAVADCNGNGIADECELMPIPGPALSFDGADSHVIALGIEGVEDQCTISCWVLPDRSDDGAIFGLYVDANKQVGLSNPANLQVSGSWNDFSTGISIADGSAHHVALSVGPVVFFSQLLPCRLYIDSELRWVGQGVVGIPWDLQGGALVLGQKQTCLGGCFTGPGYTGWLDEVRLWNYPREAWQVAADMFASLTGDEPGLVGYWPINEGEGDVTADLAGGNDGTIVDATWISTYICCPGDCNDNGVDDCDDIAMGTSTDCDMSGVPDECESYGDLDLDGDVDLRDFASLATCFTAAGGSAEGDCACYDSDGDGDVDADDYAELATQMNGPMGP